MKANRVLAQVRLIERRKANRVLAQVRLIERGKANRVLAQLRPIGGGRFESVPFPFQGASRMQLNIDPDNGVPIYEQLVRQVKYAVAEEVVVPGQVIPSVREMAKRLAVNPNTVQRAYLQLQDEQVLQALRGRGMAVAADAKARCVSDRQSVLGERLKALVSEAVRSGLPSERLKTMFEQALHEAQAAVHAQTAPAHHSDQHHESHAGTEEQGS